ncbi:MAG: NAD(P)-binding protein [Woeseiaceae bacterium]
MDITRRDFINGMALSVTAGGTLSPLELLATANPAVYPPGLAGMRGNHPGSFEVAHALAREGRSWPRPETQTDTVYDLVVVGGGISGLSAAFMFRQKAGPKARILVLDNHDDFGGHAKRNEYSVDGKTIIGYGGSQSIDTPSSYSRASAAVLRDIGIETEPFYEYFDREYFSERGLSAGVYFSEERYGRDSVNPDALRSHEGVQADDPASIIEDYPLSSAAKQNFIQLLTEPRDYLPGMDRDEKIALMRRVSYSDYLRKYVGAHEEVILFCRDRLKGLWGFGFDALSALEGARYSMPGTEHLDYSEPSTARQEFDEPYIFHFPDGNASIARALVRQLVPAAVPGKRSMEGLVAARVDYEQLDRRSNAARIRLNSTVIDTRHVDGRSAVDVTYVRDGSTYRVRGKHVILACYNHMVPHLCPDLPKAQADAIQLAEKIPLAYINVVLRNSTAFENLGYHSFYVPQTELMHSFGLDFPVNMGAYRFAESSADPVIIHGSVAAAAPDQGLTERQQHIVGRQRMYEMTYQDFETRIVRQLSGALGGGGFDAERDIAAITVNRWPHGYAYEYNELYDPPEWSQEDGPHRVGAAQIGRISIANSDAEAFAYVNGAIDAAHRAVNEQLGS